MAVYDLFYLIKFGGKNMSTELTPEQEKQVQERLEESYNMGWQNMSWILKMMKDHFGEEAYQVFAKQHGEIVRQNWSKIAEESGDNSIEAFIKHYWGEDDVEYSTEETEAGFHINCTKCFWHEKAKNLEITEQMFYMMCERDPYAMEGFNPNIGLKRTKTLMQNDDCCDFFYYYKDKSKKS
jgi:hypothetical protein